MIVHCHVIYSLIMDMAMSGSPQSECVRGWLSVSGRLLYGQLISGMGKSD